MRILRIALRNFRSYEELDLDLSGLETAAIVGKVGSGKSALIEAITFGLWGKVNRRVAFIRDDMDECVVQIDFEARGKHCSVIRTVNTSGRNSSLSFIIDGVNAPQHIKSETQDKIDKMIGLDYESIIAGPFMLQGDSGHLMQASPSARKDLLIKLFGVDQYEDYHKDALTQAQGYQRDVDRFAREMDVLEATVAEKTVAEQDLNSARYDLLTAVQQREQANADLTAARERQIALREQARHSATLRQTVDQLANRISGDQREYARVLRQISDAHQTVATPAPVFPPLVDVSSDAIEAARTTHQGLADGLVERRRIEAQMPALEAAYERSKKLAAIVDTVPCGGQGIYATCRFLTSAPKAAEIEEQGSEIERNRAAVATLPDPLAVSSAQSTYETLVAQRHAVERQSLQQEAAQQQWELKIAAARQTVASDRDNLTRLETQIARDQDVLERSTSQLAQMQSDSTLIDRVDAEVNSLKAQADEQTRSIEMMYQPQVTRAEDRVAVIAKAEAELPALAKVVKESRAKADVYTLLAKAFHRDGIPTLILENGIPLIEEHANEILSRMPGNYRLRILTQREKKKGGMAERVDVLVERPGGIRYYEDFSGGQAFRVDFAMRIALSRVLANRAGAPIETLILDEGWGTQDVEGVEALLESIAAVQSLFKLVLVITHQELVIQRFEIRLETALAEDATSSISLVA